MDNFPERFLSEMLDISREENIGLITDAVSNFLTVPNIIGVVGNYRLRKRMTTFETELTDIQTRINAKDNSWYYKQEVFPLIVQKLSGEIDDEKVTVIIDGFKHTVDDDLHDTEKLYHFFDVLEELRFSDMLFFIELYKKRKHTFVREDGIKTYQRTKFIRLGLIEDNIDLGSFDGEPVEEEIEFTEFGHEFYNLFKTE